MSLGWAATVIAMLGAICVGGCTPVLTVGADVMRPARVPLRVFPRILVVASDTEESERLGGRLIAHLESGRSTVQQTTEARSERMLTEGTLPRATVVVRIRASLTERARPVVARRQSFECGPLGCQNSRRNRIEAETVISGHAVLTVFDGASGRSLQRQAVHAEEAGYDAMAMRLRVFERLAALTAELVDQRNERVAIEFLPIESRGVRAALAAIRQGEWTRGRTLLEAVAGSGAFGRLSSEHRARVLYDLGQAHRFDGSVPADVRFGRATESLRAALLLDPQRRFSTALEELEAHQRSRRLVLEQRDATTHNFRVGRGDEAPVPQAPASYR